MWSNRKEKMKWKKKHFCHNISLSSWLLSVFGRSTIALLKKMLKKHRNFPFTRETGTLLVLNEKSLRDTQMQHGRRQPTFMCCTAKKREKERERCNCVPHFMDTLWCTIHNYTRCVHELGFENEDSFFAHTIKRNSNWQVVHVFPFSHCYSLHSLFLCPIDSHLHRSAHQLSVCFPFILISFLSQPESHFAMRRFFFATLTEDSSFAIMLQWSQSIN